MGERVSARERRLQIFESNYGRAHGWYVIHQGGRVAELVDPVTVDMFWTRYRLVPLGDDAETLSLLRDPTFWDTCPTLLSRKFGEEARAPLPAMNGRYDDGYVSYRGDAIDIGKPSVVEGLLLRWRDR